MGAKPQDKRRNKNDRGGNSGATEAPYQMKPQGGASNVAQLLKNEIRPKSSGQEDYVKLLDASAAREYIFAVGPAGTGKTLLAAKRSAELFLSGQTDRIITVRAAVAAGEELGFLPGDMKEKVDPYMRPIYDSLHDTLPSGSVVKMEGNGTLEVATVAHMRGRTLKNACVIIDEAQNLTGMQLKMLLTRFGYNCHGFITGDLEQSDVPGKNGLQIFMDWMETSSSIEGNPCKVAKLTSVDIQRDPRVKWMVENDPFATK